MGRMVIACYRAKPGKEPALYAAVEKHIGVLEAEDLVTGRGSFVMRAEDGTIVEVFEWRSAEAVDAAHSNPAVQALWAEFAEACDWVPLASLPEAQQLFAEFEAFEL
jgi:quinol monooxygenase YgiN